jgi:phage baseplate assembly protein W|tara:strand:+ start:8838 stop:9239 length:402 start_codon:yes stop_codon:yes gene_type:complete
MASGLAVKLPLVTDNTFGAYNLITDYTSLIKQNLKMLILTNPGERMMDINFGVGLRRRIFEQHIGSTYAEIDKDIRRQVKRYLPFVEVEKINFMTPENSPDLFPHRLTVQAYFVIIPLQLNTLLEIDVQNMAA